MSAALRITLLAAGLALLAALCRWLGVGEIRAAAAAASAPLLAASLLASVAAFLVYALRWRIVLRAVDPSAPEVPIGVLVALRAAEHAVSTLVPTAHLSGDPVRAALLRRRGPEWPAAIASVAMDRMLETAASAVAGPLYLAVFLLAQHRSPWTNAGLLATMLVSLTALALFFFQAWRGGAFLSALARRSPFASKGPALERIERALSAFVRTRAFPIGLALSAAGEVLIFVEIWLLVRAFGLPLEATTIVGIMLGMGVAQVVPLPAALGSLEAAQVGVLKLSGRSAELGLVVGLAVRIRDTAWIVAGLAVLWVEGLRWRTVESLALGADPEQRGDAVSSPRRANPDGAPLLGSLRSAARSARGDR